MFMHLDLVQVPSRFRVLFTQRMGPIRSDPHRLSSRGARLANAKPGGCGPGDLLLIIAGPEGWQGREAFSRHLNLDPSMLIGDSL